MIVQDTVHALSQLHRTVYKTTSDLEMRTPLLIRALEAVPRISGIEGFHYRLEYLNNKIVIRVEVKFQSSA